MLTEKQIQNKAIERYTQQFPPNPEQYVDRDFEDGALWAREILQRRIDELADETDTQRKVIEELHAENERLSDAVARLTNHIEEMQSALEK